MESYNAEIEIDLPISRNRVRIAEDLLTALTDYHPAISVTQNGGLAVIISYPAEHALQAAMTGLVLVNAMLNRHAAGAAIRGAKIKTTADFDRELGLEPLTEFVSVAEAAKMLKISQQRVRQLLEKKSLDGDKAGSTWVVRRQSVEARSTSRGASITPENEHTAPPESVTRV